MAKSSRRPPRDTRENRNSASSTGSQGDATLVDLAEDLGKLIGTTQNRMSAWLGERQEIAKTLVQIRDTANAYLRDLTAGGAELAAAIERGRRGTPQPQESETATDDTAASRKSRTPPRGKSGGAKT